MKVAIVQTSPEVNDLPKSLQKAESIISASTRSGAELIVFGECWLSGYPVWLDYTPEVGYWDHDPVKAVWARMYKNAVDLSGSHLDKIRILAKEHRATIVIGMNEVIRKGRGNGTLYNSAVIIDSNGVVANHHRKLMPTYTERMVHGQGDGHGLKTVDTQLGKLGALICWEHWMPMARQAMHDAGEDIHIALWPNVMEMHQIASRHYAFEGRCIVVAAGQVMRFEDTPHELVLAEHITRNKDKLALSGGSCIIAPNGQFLLEPQYEIDDVILADVPSPSEFTGEKMNFSASGHYMRRDVFEYRVDKRRIGGGE